MLGDLLESSTAIQSSMGPGLVWGREQATLKLEATLGENIQATGSGVSEWSL